VIKINVNSTIKSLKKSNEWGLTKLQSVLLAVQACVPLNMIAVGTASVQFFRNIGAVVGVAVFGAIMNNQLAQFGISSGAVNTSSGQNLPPEVREYVFLLSLFFSLPYTYCVLFNRAFVKAIHTMFYVAIPVAGVGFILSLFMQWIPLKKTLGGGPPVVAE
jgi:hypothetical protein